jgi:hypothetical protein
MENDGVVVFCRFSHSVSFRTWVKMVMSMNQIKLVASNTWLDEKNRVEAS